METPINTDPNLKVIDLEEISDPEALQAYGYVRLKVQRGDDVLAVRVKIRSVPQEDLDALRKKQPRPPHKIITDPKTRQTVVTPDVNDAKYVEALEAYNTEFVQEIAGRGVASKLILKDGREASSPAERFQALKERGLSGPHFTELSNAILRLTDWSDEERERLF